ncbi:hypothetical protein ACFFRR_011796 [Megaselia abdita]
MPQDVQTLLDEIKSLTYENTALKSKLPFLEEETEKLLKELNCVREMSVCITGLKKELLNARIEKTAMKNTINILQHQIQTLDEKVTALNSENINLKLREKLKSKAAAKSPGSITSIVLSDSEEEMGLPTIGEQQKSPQHSDGSHDGDCGRLFFENNDLSLHKLNCLHSSSITVTHHPQQSLEDNQQSQGKTRTIQILGHFVGEDFIPQMQQTEGPIPEQQPQAQIHQTSKINLKPFICYHCKQGFTTNFNLKIHTKRRHTDVKGMAKSFMCDCGKEFTQKRPLQHHQIGCLVHKINNQCEQVL